MANTAHMLSTSDNPWSPWTHFKEWNTWDMQAGYHTLAYLARITVSSDEISDADQDLAVEDAIEEIIRLNINGMYVAVPQPSSSVSSK
jgi:hypothetical protein